MGSVIGAHAQKAVKLGHVDSQSILLILPERKAAEEKMKKEAEQLQKQLQTMNAELEKKIAEFQQNEKTYSEAVKETNYKSIVDLQKRVQEFEVKAQQEMQKTEGNLLQPMIDKVQKAIQDVAKENGFTYIFDVTALLHASGEDITPLIKKKLSLQ